MRAGGFQGDIAIDDIEITEQTCGSEFIIFVCKFLRFTRNHIAKGGFFFTITHFERPLWFVLLIQLESNEFFLFNVRYRGHDNMVTTDCYNSEHSGNYEKKLWDFLQNGIQHFAKLGWSSFKISHYKLKINFDIRKKLSDNN